MPNLLNVLILVYIAGAILAAVGVWKNPLFDDGPKRVKRIYLWPWYMAKTLISREG